MIDWWNQPGTDLGGNGGIVKRINRRAVAAVATTVLALGALTACGEYNDERGKGDAPVAGREGEDSPKHVTNNPDGFGNVVTGCVNGAPGFRYFATTNTDKASSDLEIMKDEACR